MNIEGKISQEIYADALCYLTINSSFIPDMGLLHGRMGHVLFFAIYARFSQNKYYESLAEELLEEIYEEIHDGLPVNFEYGLCGIGWGIEFLIQNGYMDGDSDCILKDIDSRIIELDLIRMQDISFQRGVLGIAFYVVTRFSSKKKKPDIFDDKYINSLKYRLQSINIDILDKFSSSLIADCLNVLNNYYYKKANILDILKNPPKKLTKDVASFPLELENGIAGILLYNLQNMRRDILPFYDIKKALFLFTETSCSSVYGVGTYVNLLIDALQDNESQVVYVNFRSDKIKTFSIENKEGVIHINFAAIDIKTDSLSLYMVIKRYFRSVVVLLNTCFKELSEAIFVLNHMHMGELAMLLKKNFSFSSIVTIVHYMNWSFSLLGDKTELLKMLSSPDDEKNKKIVGSIKQDQLLLNMSDRIIAIAQHSYNNLLDIYKVPSCKITLIPHGIKDAYVNLSKRKMLSLRRKYGFSLKDKILIFAGRITDVKGIDILVETFRNLVQNYPNMRLIVAGNGNYDSIYTRISPHWSNVICTGFVNKEILYELFSISDIGVLPALHEEFGYVALEMMMMGLPIVGSDTSGLSELIVCGKTGVTVPINRDDEIENAINFKAALVSLLDDPLLCLQYGRGARERFLQKYSFKYFVQNVKSIL